MNFKSHYNSLPEAGEINLKPSKTIPDQSLSVKEIMTRYAQGLPISGQKVAVYNDGDEEENVPANWATLDISEKHDYIEHQKRVVKELQIDLQKQAQAKKAAEIAALRKKVLDEKTNPVKKEPIHLEEKDE